MLDAVNICPWVAVPTIVTLPVGASLTSVIENVTVVTSLVFGIASLAVTVKL